MLCLFLVLLGDYIVILILCKNVYIICDHYTDQYPIRAITDVLIILIFPLISTS